MDDLREKYMPNSQKSKKENTTDQEIEKKEVHQITKNTAQIRKKSQGKKFIESFIAEDAVNIKNYILYDVVLPAVKNTIVDAITNSVQMIFWGNSKKNPGTSRNGTRSYVSYSGYSSAYSPPKQPNFNNIARARQDFDEIILESRGEAEQTLSELVDLVIDYGHATVSDLYTMVGIQSNYTDQRWGWKDLSSAYVSRVRDGYIIKLPKTILLD